MRDAERAVWNALQQLDASWHVFYSARENSSSGWDREVDFVLIRLNRIFYCEVKGGVVVVDQRAGPGVTWAHFTRAGEAISKRADPKQLWKARLALGATIRQIAGRSPRDLGFREHDFYIFPHTPKHVTQGADLERDNIHYAFLEDIAALPARLLQIVNASKGRFIEPAHIEGIINSLDAMVIKEGAGMLPQRPQAAPEPINYKRTFRLFRWRSIRMPRLRRIAGAFILLLALAAAFMESDVPRLNQRNEPVRQTSEPVRRMSEPATPAPRSPSTAPKPPVSDPNTALPAFIGTASASEVERAISAAQDPAVYVSWQNGSEHGLVILRSDNDNGCRQYQISRHDIPPTKYATVRRCP
jgi:hypothetical protein